MTLSWQGKALPWHVAPGTFAREGIDRGTRVLLESLDLSKGQLLLDIGCGTGALGLLPHLSGPPIWSVLVEINPLAARCALSNARILGIDRALVLVGSAADAIAPGRFDVAVTNPPIRAGRDTVEEIFRGGIVALKPGGWFYMVARVRQGGWTLAKRLGAGLTREPKLVEREKGYLVFKVQKPIDSLDLEYSEGGHGEPARS